MPTYVRTDKCDGCKGQDRVECMYICPHDLMLLDRDMLWKVAPGTFDVLIGTSSQDIVLKDSFEVQSSGLALDRGVSVQPDLSR